MATSDTSTGPTERARTGTATPEPVGDSRPRRTLASYASYAEAERAVDSGGRRDFVSDSSVVADRYEVQADEGVADDADRVLAAMPRSDPRGRYSGAG